jgi:hypothetical protein
VGDAETGGFESDGDDNIGNTAVGGDVLIVKRQAEQAATQQAAMMNQQMQQSSRNTGYFNE